MAFYGLTVTEASAAIAKGDLTAEELAIDLLQRNEELKNINAFVDLDKDSVLSAARNADAVRASGRTLSRLHGIPIAFKDNINVKGYATAAGTPSLRIYRPRQSAPVANAFLNAGAIAFGKNGMHELAYGATSANPTFGAPRNPFDVACSAGGSSGGSGAAVAARLVPASIGTDTGGSVRIPAALCGVWGYRPTVGRWPSRDIVPISTTRDTPGPIARSAEDLVLLDHVVTAAPVPPPATLRGLRIGIPRRFFWDMVDTEVEAVCKTALDTVVSEGAELVGVDVEAILAPHSASSTAISVYEGKNALTAFLADHQIGLSFAEVVSQVATADVRDLLSAQLDPATAVSRETYDLAIEVHLPALKFAYENLFKQHGVHVLAFPTCRLPAPPLSDPRHVVINGVTLPAFPALIHNTDVGSTAGLPGIAIPVGLTRAGLPVGLAFDAPRGGDPSLLGLALALDRIFLAPTPPDL